MAQGGACKDIIKPPPKSLRYDVATAEANITNDSTKTTGASKKRTLPSTNDVHELLECPICTKFMYPPIHQCPKGHTLCSNCKLKVHKRCPTCCSKLGNIRCLALEKVAELLELPCQHQTLGCHDVFPYSSKLKHEQNCRFRPYNCPYSSTCSVTGAIPNLVAHLKNDHTVHMLDACTFSRKYVESNPHEVGSSTWNPVVFNCYKRHFCLHFEAFKLGTTRVYISFLRFMGEDSEAISFRYSLEVGRYGCKLTWQGVPRSIRDSHHKIHDSQEGLVITKNLADFLSCANSKELKLLVIGHIWKGQ